MEAYLGRNCYKRCLKFQISGLPRSMESELQKCQKTNDNRRTIIRAGQPSFRKSGD